jgi:hypothetical protein
MLARPWRTPVQLDELIRSLEAGAAAVPALATALSDEQARRAPAPGKWSVVEILAHLADEERDDFRHRVSMTLEDPGQPWPPIDPQGWARDRDYRSRRLAEALDDFRREREASLVWLRSLGAVDWERAYAHPKLGRLQAGDLLAAWAAHDLLHLRQLASTRLALVQAAAEPFSTRYAMP